MVTQVDERHHMVTFVNLPSPWTARRTSIQLILEDKKASGLPEMVQNMASTGQLLKVKGYVREINGDVSSVL